MTCRGLHKMATVLQTTHWERFLDENICILRRHHMASLWHNELTHNGIMTSHGITHWGRVTHIRVGNLTIIGLDNGLSPNRRQAIIWTYAGILLFEPLRINLSGILYEMYCIIIQNNEFEQVVCKMAANCFAPNLKVMDCRLICAVP